MHIKIKADNVTALFPNTGSLSYDRLYQTLLNNLPAESFIFTKRTPGAGFLQWDLPGEGWIPLSKADPLVAEMAKSEKERLFNQVMGAFNSNPQLGQKVLTVPSDEYIFYRPSESGGVEIKIAVWGYRNPSPVPDGPIIGRQKEKPTLQESFVSFIYDGQRLPEYEFFINGFKRVTDKEGILRLGMLPIGKSYDIKLNGGRTTELYIVDGQRDYAIDVTIFVTLTIAVNRNGLPAPNVDCQITYWGHTVSLTTAENGIATTTMPLDPKASACHVSVEDQTQQKPLATTENRFLFDLKTPAEPEEPEPILPEKPVEPIQPEEPLLPKEPKDSLAPEEPGKPTEPEEPGEPTDPKKPVVSEEPEAPKEFEEPLTQVEPVLDSPDIKIRVENAKGLPMSGATILFEQRGRNSRSSQLDANGTTYLSFGEYASNIPLSVTLTFQGNTLKPIVFELTDDENEYLLKALVKSDNNRLWELLAAIAGLIGTIGVYYTILQILT